jgi:periplasmic divalent cation tolerance protein
MNEKLVVALTTCETSEDAERLGRVLVERRLAACVQIGAGIRSVYPWEGRVEVAEQVPLSIKTTESRLEALKEALNALHPYEVPQLVVLPVQDGLRAYFDWAREWVGQDSK